MLRVAIVALNRVALGRPREKRLVPCRATVVSFPTPCTVAPRDQLAQELVAASTLALQGSRVAALEHVLDSEHAKKTTVAGAVVAVEVIIGILQGQESLVGSCTFPSHLGA